MQFNHLFGSWILGCAFGLIGVCWADEATHLPQRHALILANSAYTNSPLLNPRNDAELMSSTLQQLGFEVSIEHNLNREQLFGSTRKFSERLPSGAIALVFYAGHGIQVNSTNYLVPVDMQPTGEQSVPLKAFPLQNLIDHLHSAPSTVNIVILDACRNNPFRPSNSNRYRDFSNLGLAKTVIPKGTVIAYSTAPGQLAEDGTGSSNSLYTKTLTEQILKTGLTIEEALKNVAAIVRRQTLDDQQPWFETSLVDEFYFLPPHGVTLLTNSKTVSTRSDSTSSHNRNLEPSTWYTLLKVGEWAGIDFQLEKRMKNLTEDEVPLLEHRAENGNVIAMTTLGFAYRNGFFQGRGNNGRDIIRGGANNTKSVYWLQQAALAGFPIAQLELGEMILQGIGVDSDESVGMNWLERASHSNYPAAKIIYAQRTAGIDPSVALTAEGQLKTLQILMDVAKKLRE